MAVEVNKTIHTYWRDWLAVVYISICLFDFVIGAIWWNLYVAAFYEDCVARGVEQSVCFNNIPPPWQPYTLNNGGMFHIAMGAILGATAWKRHHEKKKFDNEETT